MLSEFVPSNLMRDDNFSECDPSSLDYDPVVASGCTAGRRPSSWCRARTVRGLVAGGRPEP
jgi:hypothetical protein